MNKLFYYYYFEWYDIGNGSSKSSIPWMKIPQTSYDQKLSGCNPLAPKSHWPIGNLSLPHQSIVKQKGDKSRKKKTTRGCCLNLDQSLRAGINRKIVTESEQKWYWDIGSERVKSQKTGAKTRAVF